MTSGERAALAQQREALRQRMRAQRILIAEQLDPASGDDQTYPRSKTMRFLTQRPGLAVTLLAELAALLLGARHAKSVSTLLAVVRIVQLVSNPGPRVPAAKPAVGGRSATA